MARLSAVISLLALCSIATAQCGSGAKVQVTGASGAYKTTNGGAQVYAGADYFSAINAAINAAASGDRIGVIASGSIGAQTLTLKGGQIFEGCGTINAAGNGARGAIRAVNVANVHIPYLKMTGNPYFGLQISGTTGLQLGTIDMNLSGAPTVGIRFDQQGALNRQVTIGTVTVTGASSHAVETWNIDGLKINSVIARNCGECGLLLQATTNANVGLVDGDNVGSSTGYATLRFANRNGRTSSGSYPINVHINKVKSRGGGRGIFCVSESGGALIDSIDLAGNKNNAILIENCYNVNIASGTVNGGGEVRISSRAGSGFANTRDITMNIRVDGTGVVESPCSINPKITITGNASPKTLC